MTCNTISVKEILGNKIGSDKAQNLIGMVNTAYQGGKRGNDFTQVVRTSLKNCNSNDSGTIARVAIIIEPF